MCNGLEEVDTGFPIDYFHVEQVNPDLHHLLPTTTKTTTTTKPSILSNIL